LSLHPDSGAIIRRLAEFEILTLAPMHVPALAATADRRSSSSPTTSNGESKSLERAASPTANSIDEQPS